MLAAGFSDSVVRMYNLESLGKARTKLSKRKEFAHDPKRQKGGSGDRVEPTIEVDLETAELQVGAWPLLHTSLAGLHVNGRSDLNMYTSRLIQKRCCTLSG